jgi:hypothetical protein
MSLRKNSRFWKFAIGAVLIAAASALVYSRNEPGLLGGPAGAATPTDGGDAGSRNARDQEDDLALISTMPRTRSRFAPSSFRPRRPALFSTSRSPMAPTSDRAILSTRSILATFRRRWTS